MEPEVSSDRTNIARPQPPPSFLQVVGRNLSCAFPESYLPKIAGMIDGRKSWASGLRGVLKSFKDRTRVGEGFPLEDGERVVDVDGVAHAIQDACDPGCTSHCP